MTASSVAQRPRRQATKALVLLAVYGLFALAPGAHLLWHQHGATEGPPQAASSGARDDLPRWAASCGEGCTNPHHHHGDFDRAPCALCKALGSFGDVLAPERTARLAAARGAPQRQAGELLCDAASRHAPRARAPPGSSAT